MGYRLKSLRKRSNLLPMASCKLGHIYIVNTVLSKPPKEKYALCVCVAPDYFVWINTKPAPHGRDQLLLQNGCHELVTHDSSLDLSKMFSHPDWEMKNAKEFAQISKALCKDIVGRIEAGLDVLPPRHAALIAENLRSLLKGSDEA
ncbi:hypothetical protein P6U16_08640 [Rhizobium sp. 32-5/1]|uniref:hypothetical protein n=1 Tax=Rhizobium sp. 32-5/1 TaxID=3019602 RepID=UPI00240D26BE|nr:hypothetical protein [Rhizobium sp. 32-5/1]WEZ84622.1 hypothetical protein P6U16_08640 [Rhizobium sp. 32-5/1]